MVHYSSPEPHLVGDRFGNSHPHLADHFSGPGPRLRAAPFGNSDHHPCGARVGEPHSRVVAGQFSDSHYGAADPVDDSVPRTVHFDDGQVKFMLASGPWYTSATTMGWTAIAVTVVFGVAGIALGWLGIRRRLLIYTVEWASLLLTNDLESSGAGDIEIRLREQVVDNPHLVTLTIVSRSRKDIRSSDFQKDNPLLFDFGVPIVAAKSFTFKNQPELGPNLVTPVSHGAPSQTIQINPSLIRKGPWGQLHLLTEGPPDLTCESPIADVMVREGNPATSKRIYAAIGILAGCLLFEGGIIANPLLGWPEVAIAIVLLLVATVIGGELVTAWRRRLSSNPPITLNTPLT